MVGDFILLRPFFVGQMFVRVTSYSVYSSYNDAIRICKKIIAIDKDNKQAWTSLGYAYMDLSRVDMAIRPLKKSLLDPEDKGAACFELGQAYYAKGDFTKAIVYFERVRTRGLGRRLYWTRISLNTVMASVGFRSVNSMQTLLRHVA